MLRLFGYGILGYIIGHMSVYAVKERTLYGWLWVSFFIWMLLGSAYFGTWTGLAFLLLGMLISLYFLIFSPVLSYKADRWRWRTQERLIREGHQSWPEKQPWYVRWRRMMLTILEIGGR